MSMSFCKIKWAEIKKITPVDGSVNVNKYTIYAMIPGLDTYVASKPGTILTHISQNWS